MRQGPLAACRVLGKHTGSKCFREGPSLFRPPLYFFLPTELSGVFNTDPLIAYGLAATDFVASDALAVVFVTPIPPTGALNLGNATLVGGLTAVSGKGIACTPNAWSFDSGFESLGLRAYPFRQQFQPLSLLSVDFIDGGLQHHKPLRRTGV